MDGTMQPPLPSEEDGGLARRNRLFAAIPQDVRTEWYPYLEIRHYEAGAVLLEAGATQHYVHFPLTCIVALMQMLADGASAQVALVGREGVVGAPSFAGEPIARTRAVVQSAGLAARVPAFLASAEFERGGVVMRLLLHHTQAVIAQMAQTAACNRHHSPEQQLCRWLLMMLDRADGSDIVATQELIATMLGVRRETVSDSARKLQSRGAIELRRGHVHVLDRLVLEACVCECYGVVTREYGRLLPRGR